MSDSQSTFLKHLGGKAIARFKLDPSGQPVFVEGEGGTKHYVIDLSLPPVTPEVSIVTYRLHPTYYDPVRESEDPVTHFQEQITSFGDYRLNIEAAVGSRLLAERVNLSELLRRPSEPRGRQQPQHGGELPARRPPPGPVCRE